MANHRRINETLEPVDRLEETLNRLEKMEAVMAISELKAQYLRLMDNLVLLEERENGKKNAADLASLFAEDAVWTGGEFYGTCHGRANICKFFEKLAGTSKYTKHVTMNPEIEIKGNTATALWQLVILAIDLQSGIGMWKGGFYKDSYKKTHEGHWQIIYTKVTVDRGYYEKCGSEFDYIGRSAKDGILPPHAR